MNNQQPVADQRYNIGLEFVETGEQKYVLRFCGDAILHYDTQELAQVGMHTHAVAGFNNSHWTLCVRTGSVIWLRYGKQHRIAYGADVKETRSAVQASHLFGDCVLHELSCNGVIE